jgi:hypothetical protein
MPQGYWVFLGDDQSDRFFLGETATAMTSPRRDGDKKKFPFAGIFYLPREPEGLGFACRKTRRSD